MPRNDQLVEWYGPSKSPGDNMVSEVTNTDEKIAAAKFQNDGSFAENADEYECDGISVVSSSDSQIECDSGGGVGGAMVLSDDQDRSPCFQNIEVTNSSDVHFGNKTYYQGPVTIKQILYTNPSQTDDTEQSEDKLPIGDVNCDGKLNGGYVISENANGAVSKNSNCINNINSNNLSSNWTEKNKGKKWLQRRTSKQLILGTALLILVMVSIIVLTLTLLTTYSPPENHRNTISGEGEPMVDQPDNDPEDPDNQIEMIPKWIDRTQWLAMPTPRNMTLLNTPVPVVVIHHTATEDCFTLADCKAQVQFIQKFHMKSNNWSDIGYNFLVGSDGYIYEGRGWTKMGAHVKGYNYISIGLAFIGLFDDHLPPKKTLKAAQAVIDEGLKLNYIRDDYQLIAMRQLSTFKSPGKKLYELIKTWPHWSPTLRLDEGKQESNSNATST